MRQARRRCWSLALTTAVVGAAVHAQAVPVPARPEAAAVGIPAAHPTERIDADIETLRTGSDRARWRALHSLVLSGERAVPALERLLHLPSKGATPHPGARMAAETLRRIGPRAVRCLPDVFELTGKGDAGQSLLAVRVLQDVGRYDREGILRYCDELRMKRTQLRRATSRDDPVVPCLVRLLEPTDDDDVEGWIRLLHGKSADHREMALEHLLRLGERARPAVAAVKAALRGSQPTRTTFKFQGTQWSWSGSISVRDTDTPRRLAAELLTALGETRDVQVEVDLALLTHDDPAVRHRSVLSLGAKGDGATPRVVRALEQRMADDDKVVAWDAITALGMLGPSARSALDRLRLLAKDPDKARATRAIAAIRQIDRAPR